MGRGIPDPIDVSRSNINCGVVPGARETGTRGGGPERAITINSPNAFPDTLSNETLVPFRFKSPGNQKGFTTTAMTMRIISNVVASLAMR